MERRSHTNGYMTSIYGGMSRGREGEIGREGGREGEREGGREGERKGEREGREQIVFGKFSETTYCYILYKVL